MKKNQLYLLIAVCFLSVSACRSPDRSDTVYSSDEYGIKITPPPGWRRTTPSFTADTFWQFEPSADHAALYVGVVADPVAIFGSIQDSFMSLEQYFSDIYSGFITLTSSVVVVSGEEAVRFSAALHNERLEGVYLRKSADEYFIVMNPGEKPSENIALFENMLADIEVSGTEYGRNEAAEVVALIKPLNSIKEAREVMKTGQQLLYSRDVDINNYSRAINKFMTVLVTLKDENPKPPEYQEALTALMITRSFRKTKLHELRVVLERSIALRNRKAAMRAADDIMKLYPHQQSQPYRYALQRWKKASSIPSPDA